MNLDINVTQLNRVGTALGKRLKHLGVDTVRDLLFYFPLRYEDFSQIVPIKNLVEGDQVTIKGRIELISNKRSPRKRMMITESVVADETGQIRIVWFGQPFIAKTLRVGDMVYFSGRVTGDMFGTQMVSPSYEKAKLSPTHTARIVPIYSLTSGMTQKQLRFLISQIIDLSKEIPEWLPEDLLEKADLMPLAEAIKAIHFPESSDEMKHAERRLKFDELFVLQLRAEMIRQSIKRSKAPKIQFKEEETKTFVSALPFALTKDQKVAAWEILQDMEKEEPMNRLLEGDVGSGKTVVAALSMYNAMLNAYQAVIMAPTEILAKQHFESLKKLLGGKAVVGILTRTESGIMNPESGDISVSKSTCIELIKTGKVQVIVGTHALLTEAVQFQKLGLVIVDEQHRFGVGQRKMIREKSGMEGLVPHFLSMTATPIPRSFALSLYGDLDISIIKQMPAGRKVIKTRLVDPHNREKAYQFIQEQVKQGRQVFVVCPLIALKDKGDETKDPIADFGTFNEKKTVMDEYEKLSQKIFPHLRVGFLHGKLKSKEKDETMGRFAAGELDILVSTSVVEVGVNIPNASVMMIEGAERFGLAQLHQFRGRVGRSDHQSYCFLFTDSDSEIARARLEYFEQTTDGFALAEYDLDTRGPGEVYGTSQSGMMNLRLATMKDRELIKLAREVARGIDFEKYASLKNKVKEWEGLVHLE